MSRPDNSLSARQVGQMVRQLEFYFSDLNLKRDAFLQRQLRRDSTAGGWVPLSVVASFNKMKKLAGGYVHLGAVCSAVLQSSGLVLGAGSIAASAAGGEDAPHDGADDVGEGDPCLRDASRPPASSRSGALRLPTIHEH